MRVLCAGGVAKFSGGNVYYFPSYHSIKNPVEVKRFEAQLTRYLTRKIGFEAVMRIRCTRGNNTLNFFSLFYDYKVSIGSPQSYAYLFYLH
jgi:protein transport protein SEC24